MRRPRKLGFDETIAREKMPADRDIARSVCKNGALRPMEIGTIVSPWRYDAAAA
jgi:hypothetical protein